MTTPAGFLDTTESNAALTVLADDPATTRTGVTPIALAACSSNPHWRAAVTVPASMYATSVPAGGSCFRGWSVGNALGWPTYGAISALASVTSAAGGESLAADAPVDFELVLP